MLLTTSGDNRTEDNVCEDPPENAIFFQYLNLKVNVLLRIAGLAKISDSVIRFRSCLFGDIVLTLDVSCMVVSFFEGNLSYKCGVFHLF